MRVSVIFKTIKMKGVFCFMKKCLSLFIVLALLALTGSAFAANPTVEVSPHDIIVKFGEATTATLTGTAANGGTLTYAVTETTNNVTATISGATVTITAPLGASNNVGYVTVTVTETYTETDEAGHTSTKTAEGTARVTVYMISAGSAETGGISTLGAPGADEYAVAHFGADVKDVTQVATFIDSQYASLHSAQNAVNRHNFGFWKKGTAMAALPGMHDLDDNGNYVAGVALPGTFKEEFDAQGSDEDNKPLEIHMVSGIGNDGSGVATVDIRVNMAVNSGWGFTDVTTKGQIRQGLNNGGSFMVNFKTSGGQLVSVSLGDVYSSAVDIDDPILVMVEASDEHTPGSLSLSANPSTLNLRLGQTETVTLTASGLEGTASYTFTADDERAGVTLAKSTGSSTTAAFTPTAAGTYRITFTVTDSATGNTASTPVTLAVTGSNNPGSSGGGCSAGFTAISLSILGAFITLRRKQIHAD